MTKIMSNFFGRKKISLSIYVKLSLVMVDLLQSSWISVYIFKRCSLSVFVPLSFLPLFLIAYHPNSLLNITDKRYRRVQWARKCIRSASKPTPLQLWTKGTRKFPKIFNREDLKLFQLAQHNMPTYVPKGQTGYMNLRARWPRNQDWLSQWDPKGGKGGVPQRYWNKEDGKECMQSKTSISIMHYIARRL